MSAQRNEEEQFREIQIKQGEPESVRLFPTNYISTGKYTILSIIPKNLFEQFHRVANIWFLIVSIFQVLPLQLSPTSSWATIAPLSLVLTVTLVKDGYLDYLRHKSDKRLNNRVVQVWSNEENMLVEKRWRDLEVGNLIFLENDSPVPADIVIFNTSEREKICYIETSNLDGESTLKIKRAVEETSILSEHSSLDSILAILYKLDQAVLSCEHPNNRLYNFEGSLRIKGHPKPVALENDHLLLRGSTIKNTKWVFGFVVYTGVDSKLMMNSKSPPHKRSKVERQVNSYLAYVFSLLFAASALSTAISVIETYEDESKAEYFSGQSGESSVLNFITFMILYNSLVPISLYVTMDVIRIIQVQFIQCDLRMYYPPLDQPAVAKTGDLNEDLGQVEYIFSDKTGTLTENLMEFKRCSIAGELYGSLEPLLDESEDSNIAAHPKFKFFDPCLAKHVRERRPELNDFFECLAVCHTVITDKSESGEVIYQAASPDEEALVIAARCMGYAFQFCKAGYISLDVLGEKRQFSLIGTNEFNSDRKRMSVVVRNLSDLSQPAILYCKGADNTMLPRMRLSETEEAIVQDHLREFSVEGLRTLVLAKRQLTESEVRDFDLKWTHAKNAIADRCKRLDAVAEEFEVGMQLIGVTAIEDKIQENVPEIIANLMHAGIKIWVITGDKQETAINIAYASKLFKKSMSLAEVNVRSIHAARQRLQVVLDKYIRRPGTENEELVARPIHEINLGLVVDGESLIHIFQDEECLRHFSMISCLCLSVICCRVSPLQKAQMVRLVKQHFSFRPMTLAIGDGANDVSMIQEAHVGVGISGNEGMQAANSSDYAICRFKFLLPLLFLHGRWNYRRLSLVVLYSFYKNFLLVLPMFYYSFRNLYSGTALYDSWLIMSYNVALTALPIIILGTIDKDLSAEEVLSSPKLYHSGLFSRKFNGKVFLQWLSLAIVHSMIIYFFVEQSARLAIASSGYSEDLLTVGTSAFICVVQTASYVILIEMKEISWLFAVILALSNGFMFFYIWFYDVVMFPSMNLAGIYTALFNFSPLVLVLFLAPVCCVMINLALLFGQVLWRPNRADRVRKRRRRQKVHAERVYMDPEIRSESFGFIPTRAVELAKNLIKVFNPKGLKEEVSGNKDNRKDVSLKHYTLQFNSPFLEKEYRNQRSMRIISFIRKIFIMITILALFWTVISLFTNSELDPELAILRGVTLVLMIGIIGTSYTKFFLLYYENIMIFMIICGLMIKTALDVMSESDGSMIAATVPILTFVLFDIATYKVLIINLIFLVVYLLRVCWMYSQTESANSVTKLAINYTLLLTVIIFLSAYVGYTLERAKREEYVLIRHLKFQYKRGQDILGTLLPKFVRDRVKEGVRYIAEDKGVVTVLFCDIYDFDKICATHTPNELLDLLDKFFSILDGLCEKHGVTKIETVGKTYMACGGLKDSDANMPQALVANHHAIRVIELAFDIIEKIEPVFLKTGEKFHVKIGINTGPVVAGVVGEHKPQFSLVGDTVNIASRMCSNVNTPDYIQISHTTYGVACEMPWEFESRFIDVKGRGLTQTYYVSKHKVKNMKGQRITFQEMSGNTEEVPETAILQHSFNKSRVVDSSKLQTHYSLMDIEERAPPYHALVQEVQWLSCSFMELKTQNMFRIHYTETNFKLVKAGMIFNTCIFGVLLCVYIFHEFMMADPVRFTYIEISIRTICMVGLGTMAGNLRKIHKSLVFSWLTLLLYCLQALAVAMSVYSYSSFLFYKIVLEMMYLNLVTNHISALPFGFILIGSLFSFSCWILLVILNEIYMDVSVEATFFILIFIILNGAVSYKREQQSRRSFNLKILAKKEIDNTDTLLRHMMPPNVVKNLQNDIITTDKYSEVTIIFADICGFTNWSSNKTPIEVITMLSKLFSAFDNLCAVHGVYKVHTIGDCYVILSFTDPVESDFEGNRNIERESTLMISMALDMIKTIKKINRSKKIDLNMRIGIHTGEVIAGISGTNIVRYDIYGPDVDIANKMESGGQPGAINVSEDTMNILKRSNPDRFEYAFNKVITHEPTERDVNSFFVNPIFDADCY